jgi:hypothetical protein
MIAKTYQPSYTVVTAASISQDLDLDYLCNHGVLCYFWRNVVLVMQ